MSGDLRSDLDQLAGRASEGLRAQRARRILRDASLQCLVGLVAIPGAFLIAALILWGLGADPGLFDVGVVGVLTALLLATILVRAYLVGRRADVPAGRALAEVDRRLALEDRLVTADEFLREDRSEAFHRAALADAAECVPTAHAARLHFELPAWNLARPLSAAVAASAILWLLLAWTAAQGPDGALPANADGEVVAVPGALLAMVDEPTSGEDQRQVAPDERRPSDPPRSAPAAVGERPPAAPTPELSDVIKESAGKSGAGRSAGALSSSAASQSRSSPSTQGQASKPSDKKLEPKASKAKRSDDEREPEAREEEEQEDSGSTAGRGASKGSNKNPTASDWRSRDQVTNEDDQEIEDDDEAEDDEEEQESRGGVQPNLRDRRPPVSRDLQIGFGNRPNPDANGRGGPSQPKKSRGVASLVLGVPIPDRVKGRPGPGPTKITQERIEPEGEEAAPIDAGARAPRSQPAGRLAELHLDPDLRDLVRAYFLTLRNHEGTR